MVTAVGDNTTVNFDDIKVQDYQPSVFRASLPHGIACLAITGVGTAAAVAAIGSSVPATIAGVAIALFGGYGFFATVVTAVAAKNADEFYANIWPAYKITAGLVVTEMITVVARVIFQHMVEAAVNSLFNRR